MANIVRHRVGALLAAADGESLSRVENDDARRNELIARGKLFIEAHLSAAVVDGAKKERKAARLLGQRSAFDSLIPVCRPDLSHNLQLLLKHMVKDVPDIADAIGRLNYIARVSKTSGFAQAQVSQCTKLLFLLTKK